MRTQYTYSCDTCGGSFLRKPSEIRRNATKYCSPACQNPLGPAARFWQHVNLTGDCWLWTANRQKAGYGRFWAEGATVSAHRFAYVLAYGVIPTGMDVCHRCDNPSCVRPSHLWLGTHDDNMADKTAKGRAPKGDGNGSRTHPERLQRGEQHHGAKLTTPEVVAIRALHAAGGMTYTAIGRRYGMDPTTISDIVRRHIWVHV